MSLDFWKWEWILHFFSTVNGTCLRGPFFCPSAPTSMFFPRSTRLNSRTYEPCEMAEAHMSLAVAIPFATYLTVSPTTSLSQELSGILSVHIFWKPTLRMSWFFYWFKMKKQVSVLFVCVFVILSAVTAQESISDRVQNKNVEVAEIEKQVQESKWFQSIVKVHFIKHKIL